ncbi:MAG: hypothetical protein Kow0058_17390 [Roseovarius sp.]
MQRRHFILTALLAAAVRPGPARAGEGGMIDYDDSDPISRALAEGRTVLVDYYADWCSTCAAQERVIAALRAENPAYDENIVFVRVDWDVYADAPVTTSRNIPRRSTLIVLKGGQELGRVVAGTSRAAIKALLDGALQAATAS